MMMMMTMMMLLLLLLSLEQSNQPLREENKKHVQPKIVKNGKK